MSRSRRRFLHGLGLGFGLGGLGGLGGLLLPSLSGDPKLARAGTATPPKRLVIMFTAHGCVHANWRMRPQAEPETVDFEFGLGPLGEADFSPILAPLHRHREQLLIVDGLSQISSYLDPNNFDPHAEGHLAALTGSLNDPVHGEPLASGPSVDQLVAAHISDPSRLASLELSLGGAGNRLISYTGPRTPVPVESDPTRVWERIFGSPGSSTDADSLGVYAGQAAVLDQLQAEYGALASAMSGEDRLRLEQHRQHLQDLERRFIGMRELDCGPLARPDPEQQWSYQQRHELMISLLSTALACDATRVATILHPTLPGELCGAPGKDMHDAYAHSSRDDAESIDKMTTYGQLHAEHMAKLIDALAQIPEGEGSLLDHTLVVWVSELGNGEHAFETWPVVIAGGSEVGGWQLGRYLRMAPRTPGLADDWQMRGNHELDWPNDMAGVPHQQLLVSIAQAFGVSGDEGELRDSVGLKDIQAPDGSTIDLRGGLF